MKRGCAIGAVLATMVASVACPAAAGNGAPASTYRLGPAPKKAPQRVVTLAPSLTETVIALDAGQRLVGVSRYDTLPAVHGLPRVGGYLDPNLEAILALRPDLVIAQPSPGNQAVVEKLAQLGVTVRVVEAHTLEQVEAMIRAIAADLHVTANGARVIAALEAKLRAVRAAAKGLVRPRALLVVGHHPLVVAGPGTYGDELLRLAGAKNVVGRAVTPYPVWPLEQVVATNPAVIVDMVVMGGAAERPAAYAHIPSLSAMRHHRVVRVTSQALMHPGPGLGDGAVALFEAIHPEAKAKLRAALAAGHEASGKAAHRTKRATPR